MSAPPTLRILSFKLRPIDTHVWIVREGEPHGKTLRGDEARSAFVLGEALFSLACPDAPQRVRALSVDCTRWRLLATVDEGNDKPTPVRIDGEPVRTATTADVIAFLRG